MKRQRGYIGGGIVLHNHAGPTSGGNRLAAFDIPVRIVKPALESLSNNITLQDDNDLFYSIAANEEIFMSFNLFMGLTMTVTGVRFTLTGPAGATLIMAYKGAPSTSDYQQTDIFGVGMLFPPANFSKAGAFFTVGAWVKNGANPGVIHLQWAQHTSSASLLAMLAGSQLIVHRIG
jgi:hypothetical protein